MTPIPLSMMQTLHPRMTSNITPYPHHAPTHPICSAQDVPYQQESVTEASEPPPSPPKEQAVPVEQTPVADAATTAPVVSTQAEAAPAKEDAELEARRKRAARFGIPLVEPKQPKKPAAKNPKAPPATKQKVEVVRHFAFSRAILVSKALYRCRMTRFLPDALQGSVSRKTRQKPRRPKSKMERSVLPPKLNHRLTQKRKKSAENERSVLAYVSVCHTIYPD